MDANIFLNDERYDKFKEEVLNDFNHFFIIDEDNSRVKLKNLDIKFSDELINDHAYIEISKDRGYIKSTKLGCRFCCWFLRPDTLSPDLAYFHFYPKHARILLGKEGTANSVTLERSDCDKDEYPFNMILTLKGE